MAPKSRLSLPDDLRAFLRAGRQLEYDAGSCECGRVTLLGPRQLRLTPFTILTDEMQFVYGDPRRGKGYYYVPAVNLVATCEHYHPFGVLLWIPREGMFGSWDSDHHVVKVFLALRVRGDAARMEPVTWTDIEADPPRFINAQWNLDATTGKFLIPWPKYRWKPR